MIFIFLHSERSDQPGISQPHRKHKYFLVSGLVGNETALPPVIFTDDATLPEMTFENAYVITIASSKAPSVQSSLVWFDTIKEYLEDKPLLLLDNLKAHHNNSFQEELHDFEVSTMFYPPLTRCLLNPCDNAFHSTLKCKYLQKDRNTHQACIKSMIESYY